MTEQEEIEWMIDQLWPIMRQVTGMGGRTEYWNREETRKFVTALVRARRRVET